MNPVQQKISCVYETGVLDEPSYKRQHQSFRVAATRELKSSALEDKISSARASEKIDGTCCLVTEFQGQPWLWARHDRKPSKVGEKRFAQHKRSRLLRDGNKELQTNNDSNKQPFTWDPMKDFKDVPEHWKPALGLQVLNGIAMPDEIGHTPGWIPVQRQQRQHCWHMEAVDLDRGLALVLREADNSPACVDLVIESVPLSSLMDQTCELIGTNINGNPYGLGTKKHPFHVLVPHGAIALTCPDPSDYDSMWDWMTSDLEEDSSNKVEGVVWHCQNGALYKLHKHHLNLRWPEQQPMLSRRPVSVQLDSIENHTHLVNREERGGGGETSDNDKSANMFVRLRCVQGQRFNSLLELCAALTCDESDD